LGRKLKTDDTIRKLQIKLPQLADSFLEDGYDGIAFHSSSILIYANKGAAEAFGYSEEELPGMNSWLLFKPESAKTIMQHLVSKSSSPYRVKAVRKDKTEFEVELKGKDFEINGEPVRSVLIKKV